MSWVLIIYATLIIYSLWRMETSLTDMAVHTKALARSHEVMVAVQARTAVYQCIVRSNGLGETRCRDEINVLLAHWNASLPAAHSAWW